MSNADAGSNSDENIFKGNAAGLYMDKYNSRKRPANVKLKPEQTEGEFIVSGHSMKSVVPPGPYDQNHPGKQQIIYD